MFFAGIIILLIVGIIVQIVAVKEYKTFKYFGKPRDADDESHYFNNILPNVEYLPDSKILFYEDDTQQIKFFELKGLFSRFVVIDLSLRNGRQLFRVKLNTKLDRELAKIFHQNASKIEK